MPPVTPEDDLRNACLAWYRVYLVWATISPNDQRYNTMKSEKLLVEQRLARAARQYEIAMYP